MNIYILPKSFTDGMREMRIQGGHILHAFDYLKRKRGMEGINAVHKEVGFDIQEIHPEAMYPFEWFIQSLKSISQLVNKSGYSMPSRIGYNHVHEIAFLKSLETEPGPISALEKFQDNWEIYFDFGKIELWNKQKGSVEIYISNYTPQPEFCEYMNGFLIGLLRVACLLKDADVTQTKCISNGDDGCLFELGWG